MKKQDLVQLRQKAGSLKSKDLRDAAEDCGWIHVRTKGGHHAFSKPGKRTLIIQETMNRGTAVGIINALINALEEE